MTAQILTIDFLDANGAVIAPPSQYAFASSDPALVVGLNQALNAVTLIGGIVPKPGIAITVTCPGITNGTATIMADVVTASTKVVLA